MMKTLSSRSILSALVAAGLLAAAPAVAQTEGQAPAAEAQAEPAQEISASHLAAARRAIAAIDATDEFDNILPNAATQVKAELIPNNPDREQAISDMVDERALELAPRRGALETEIARVYAGLFSEEHLNAMADFYESEAGQALIENGPAATRETIAAVEVWSNGIVRDLRESAFQGMGQMNIQAGGQQDEAEGGGEQDGAEGGEQPQ